MPIGAVALKTQPSTLTQFGYDLAGRLLGVTNGSYRAAYTYLANAPLVSQIALRSNTVTRMTTTKTKPVHFWLPPIGQR